VDNGKVGLRLFALWRLWLLEVWMFAQVLVIQLLHEGHVICLWHNALLVQHGDDTQRLFDQINAGLQVETEVDEGPGNALPFVLLLLQDEHVMVEELLQFLVDKVDPKLFEAVQVEDFKA
jgi:hypothetical protein